MEDEHNDKDRCVASKYLTYICNVWYLMFVCPPPPTPRPIQESIEKVRRP